MRLSTNDALTVQFIRVEPGSLGRWEGDEVVGELADLARAYVAERVALGEFNGNTPQVVTSVLLGFARACQDVALGDLGREHVNAWLAPYQSAGTRRTMLCKVRPFVKWLAYHGHIERDFAALMKPPKLPAPEPRFLEAEEAERLVAVASTARDRMIVLLMLHLGLRRIEVSRIDVEDIDFKGQRIGVRGKNGQGQITRRLPVPDEAWRALTSYLGERPTFTGPLVRAMHGPERLSEGQVAKVVRTMLEQAGLKAGPWDGISSHSLRHSFAQHLIDQGVDIHDVQDAMGHANVTTTEIYRRRRGHGLRAVMEGRSYGRGA